MVNGKKTIALCLTKIHDITKSAYTAELFECCENNDYKLVVLNSFYDFFYENEYLSGSKTVFSDADYSIFDAVVVFPESIYSNEVIDIIKQKSKEADIPVIMVKGDDEECYCIVDDYVECFKDLIRHVVVEHNAKDTFFISGIRGEAKSELRVQCYKEVLEENGLEFSEDNVEYGGFWNIPTERIVDKLILRDHLPQAIICANDTMAMAVCDRLAYYGVSVPKDVIVTGFDGIEQAAFNVPSITTCKENIKELAKITFETADKLIMGAPVNKVINNKYSLILAESCGCKTEDATINRKNVNNMYNILTEMGGHEDFVFSKIDRILDRPSLKEALRILSYLIQDDSFLFVDNTFLNSLSTMSDANWVFDKEWTLLESSDNNSNIDQPYRSDTKLNIFRQIGKSLKDRKMAIICPVFVGEYSCGVYCLLTDSVLSDSHKIKRITKAINICLNDLYSRMKQKQISQVAEHAVLSNPVTNLPNLKGCNEWFNKLSEKEENRKKRLTFSVYKIARFKSILEDYGMVKAEHSLKGVADSLVNANNDDAFIGHFSEDEFVVVNVFEDTDDISITINSAVANFYMFMDDFNHTSKEEFFVEVNCGCAEVSSGWEGRFTSFIKFASAELYMNTLKMNQAKNKEKGIEIDVDQDNFELLVEQNMFRYCFQPIVNARTGEIYAYEALMRTQDPIKMSPVEILNTASKLDRLYDIEKATIFNVMENYVRRIDEFEGKKVFINLIPGYFLNDNDYGMVVSKFGSYIDNFVFEFTEQNSVSDFELERVKKLGGPDKNNSIAVDDYGTGHSNIVNLLRYSPQIIKIDRFLITDVDKDVNKQMFIKSTIEFAKLNGIKVLAEGVETSEELKTIVEYGVDYIQGYYTGKPAFDPISEIKESIKQEIVASAQLF